MKRIVPEQPGERVKDERIFNGDIYNPVANLHGIHSICIKKAEKGQRGKQQRNYALAPGIAY